eukprot:7693637-Heterocapsa_arctica.AAC.1
MGEGVATTELIKNGMSVVGFSVRVPASRLFNKILQGYDPAMLSLRTEHFTLSSMSVTRGAVVFYDPPWHRMYELLGGISAVITAPREAGARGL